MQWLLNRVLPSIVSEHFAFLSAALEEIGANADTANISPSVLIISFVTGNFILVSLGCEPASA